MSNQTLTQSSPVNGADSASDRVRFHLALNVKDLERSVAFFRTFLGHEPVKHRSDYAKFELDQPPLVLSLEPCDHVVGGSLSHLGFRMPDAASLVEVQRRLEESGVATRREEGVECCYARQTKFWVHDPDQNLWEIYTLDEDLEHRGSGSLPVIAPEEAAADGPPPAIWAHRLGDAFPAKLPILDQTVDRVHFEGTFNQKLAADEIRRRLAEARRVLKPGGAIHLHMLTSDKSLGDRPVQLPGPASRVECVPELTEMEVVLREAGFTEIATQQGQSPCFTLGECGLRETRIEARGD